MSTEHFDDDRDLVSNQRPVEELSESPDCDIARAFEPFHR
jgi:hypothetical protein